MYVNRTKVQRWSESESYATLAPIYFLTLKLCAKNSSAVIYLIRVPCFFTPTVVWCMLQGLVSKIRWVIKSNPVDSSIRVCNVAVSSLCRTTHNDYEYKWKC